MSQNTSPPQQPGAADSPLGSDGPTWVATEARTPVIELNQSLIDLTVQSSATGARVAIVSGERSRMTEPLRDLLTSLGGRWVVCADDGGIFDGLSGRILSTSRTIFEPDPDVPVHPAFTTPGPASQAQLIVSWSLRINPKPGLVVGASVETFLSALGTSRPTGWGPYEPVDHEWNPSQLTEFIGLRLPQPTRLVITASDETPAVFTMTIQQTAHGLEELVTGLISIGAWADPASRERADRAASALAGFCQRGMPLFGLVLVRDGPADLTWAPRQPAGPLPVAMLIGPPAVRHLELDPGQFHDQFGAIVAGRPKLPGLVFPLRPDSPAAASRWADILRAIGVEKLASVLVHTP
jgi:hypothetical protein